MLHRLNQTLPGILLCISLQQPQRKRSDQLCLPVCIKSACLYKQGVVGRLCSFSRPQATFPHAVFAQNIRYLSNGFHCIIQIRGAFLRVPCLCAVYLVTKFLRLQPFTQMNTFFIRIGIVGVRSGRPFILHAQMRHEIIRIFLHHGPGLFQNLPISIAFIITIGNQIHCVRPAHGGAGGFIHHFHALIGKNRR